MCSADDFVLTAMLNSYVLCATIGSSPEAWRVGSAQSQRIRSRAQKLGVRKGGSLSSLASVWAAVGLGLGAVGSETSAASRLRGTASAGGKVL